MKVLVLTLTFLVLIGWSSKQLTHDSVYTYAYDTSRAIIAGYGITSDNKWQALVWIKQGETWAGYTLHDSMLMNKSEACATDGRRVGGYIVNVQGRINAVVWTAPPQKSFINLHPSNYNHSRLNDMTSELQVGFTINSLGKYNAALWMNSSESHVNLHEFLPNGFTESTALSVNSDNKRIVGFALKDGLFKPVVWSLE